MICTTDLKWVVLCDGKRFTIYNSRFVCFCGVSIFLVFICHLPISPLLNDIHVKCVRLRYFSGKTLYAVFFFSVVCSFRTLQISLKAVFIVMLKIIYDHFKPAFFLSISLYVQIDTHEMNAREKKNHNNNWQIVIMMADQHQPKLNERNYDEMEWLLCEPRTFRLIYLN